MGFASFRGFNDDPLVNATFIYGKLFLFHFYKEIGILLMRIVLEFVSLSELRTDLASSVTLLPNFIFFRLGVSSSFNFFDSLVFSSGASLSRLFSIVLCLWFFFFFKFW